MSQHPHYGQTALTAGPAPDQARGGIILLHGRGATAHDILGLYPELDRPDWTAAAPQATGSIWLPGRYFAPLTENQPWLDSALAVIDDLVVNFERSGLRRDHIWLAGFSQGACLAYEYLLTRPSGLGGLLAFSGSVLGPDPFTRTPVDLSGTPVLVSCGLPDPWFAERAVRESADLLRRSGAVVFEVLEPGVGHYISPAALAAAKTLVAGN